ncbi:MAG: LuxR C-terminal-related transcriptional regulator [Niameybacter sp.]
MSVHQETFEGRGHDMAYVKKRKLITEKELLSLYKAKNYPTLVPLLEKLSEEDLGRVQLWKYRKIYRSLPEEEIDKSPALCSTLAVLAVLSDDIILADSYVKRLQTMQLAYRTRTPEYAEIENYLKCLEVALPHRGGKTIYGILKSLASLIGSNGQSKMHLSITANRPGIINGGRDFCSYGKYVPMIRGPLKLLAKSLYGKEGTGMVDTAVAELYYQQDKIHEALVLVVSTIPFIERDGHPSILFAALYIQVCIMTISGQLSSIKPMLDEMRERILLAEADYLLPNLNAFYVWGALYDGDYTLIDEWMEKEAPRDMGELCTLDRFQYFVKLRVYLLYGRHLSLIALAGRLRPILLDFQRTWELCELNLLLAMSYYDEEDEETAFTLLDEALATAENYRLDRVVADEGGKMYLLLRAYMKSRGETPYLLRISELAHQLGLYYPDYLKGKKEKMEPLTTTEHDVLRLIAVGRSNAEIADYLNITVRTVKYHTSNIFQKLAVKNRQQAVAVAREVGLI